MIVNKVQSCSEIFFIFFDDETNNIFFYHTTKYRLNEDEWAVHGAEAHSYM